MYDNNAKAGRQENTCCDTEHEVVRYHWKADCDKLKVYTINPKATT